MTHHLPFAALLFTLVAALTPCRAADAPPPLDVRVTVELDASHVEPRFADLHARLEALESRVALLETPPAPPDGETPDQPKPTPPVPPAIPSGGGGIGMNLANPTFWSTNWVYRDLMLQARFRQGEWRAFKDVPRGWFPAPDAGYAVEGPAKLKSTKNGIDIIADEGAPAAGVHVWMPGTKDKPGLFHPLYLERLRPFTTLRFLDWLAINNTDVTTWDDRTRHATPIEHAIELCNDVNADAWFCMPHLADDGYVRNFAELVKAKLHTSGKVYVEWSNEVWNSSFSQNKWVNERAKAEGVKIQDVWAREAGRDFAIWRDVFQGQEHRLVRVVAGQSANASHVRMLCDRLGKGNFDAVSCAAYIHLSPKNIPDDATADKLLGLYADKLARTEGDWREHAELAEKYGVPLIAYEAGQHLTPGGKRNRPWYDAWVAAQRDPRMADLYRDLIARWRSAGGGLLMAYLDCRKIDHNGAWGALEYQSQPTEEAPKYRALIEAAGGS